MINLITLILFFIFQVNIFCENIKLEKTKNYELTNFEPHMILPLLYQAKGVPTKDVTWGRFTFVWTRPSDKKDFYLGQGRLSLTAMAVLKSNVPNKQWIAISCRPDRDDQLMTKDGQKNLGASIDIENGELKNNFAIVELDWDVFEGNKAKGKYDKDHWPDLKTVWDPQNGIQDSEFQEHLCKWLNQINPDNENVQSVCKVSSEAVSPPKKPVSPPKTTETTTPKTMSKEEEAELVAQLTELAGLLGLLSRALQK